MANTFSFQQLRRYLTVKRLRLAALVMLLLLSAFVLYLDMTVRAEFEGKRWALPARVYARPLEIYPGVKLSPAQLALELNLLGYRNSIQASEPGSYRRGQQEFDVVTRSFTFGDGQQDSLSVQISFDGDRIQHLSDRDTGAVQPLIRLEPLRIGNIYPTHKQDRLLVKLDEVPPALVNGLIAVEDRKFYSHYGIDPRGMARAIVSTLSGAGIQGGSTLTQQLVKNFFLSSERTLRRKFTEILMAPLLELHYQKTEILEAYINEIYLAQDGERAIHGFGLASQYYFDRPLAKLSTAQAALLVGMVKGPSYYDPRRHPQRALERRNLVLSEMQRQEFITQEQYVAIKAEPLGVTSKPPSGTSLYPAFLDLVHRQLQRDYREEDLRSEGLKIFTTFDPWVQGAAENALATRLTQLEKSRRLPANSLEGAVVVTSVQNGEVQAVLGGRDARFEGFDRALDAKRPVGSLIKPVIYLTALERAQTYTLLTPLNDDPLVWREPGIDDWKPNNYDKKFHGQVPLRLALVNSYNVSSARLGLDLGVSNVMSNARRLGAEQELPTYASSLLGAFPLTPIEVSQLYQSLASGGFRTPLRVIREILTADNQPLQRYPLSVDQVADPAAVYLLTYALQDVVREGTAQGLKNYLPADLQVAGKTGTTDDLRDSWFAGYTGDHVAVVWVGRDDNGPIGLTGASGAMTVWGQMMRELDPERLNPPQPENVEFVWIDPATQTRADKDCAGAIQLPFIRDTAPTETSACVARSPVKKIKGWFKGIFN